MDSHWVSHGVARSTQTTKLRVCIHARTQRFRTILTRLSRDGHACVRRVVVRSSCCVRVPRSFTKKKKRKRKPNRSLTEFPRYFAMSHNLAILTDLSRRYSTLVSSSSSSSSFSPFGTPFTRDRFSRAANRRSNGLPRLAKKLSRSISEDDAGRQRWRWR